MAAKKSSKAAPSVRPVKEKMTKSALVRLLAEQNEVSRKTVTGILESLESVLLGSVHPRGVGEFTMPGIFKMVLRKVPARKAGTLIRNPATGEMVPAAAKPASIRVKIRPLAKVKTTANS